MEKTEKENIMLVSEVWMMMDGRTDRWMDRRMDGWMDKYM